MSAKRMVRLEIEQTIYDRYINSLKELDARKGEYSQESPYRQVSMKHAEAITEYSFASKELLLAFTKYNGEVKSEP